MKRIFITLLLISYCCLGAEAQIKRKSYFPIWTYQQKDINVNGLSVGLVSGYEFRGTNTNGIKLEAIGTGILLPLFPKDPMETDLLTGGDYSERINGLSLSATGTICNCLINGLSVGWIGQLVAKVNGISVVQGLNMVFEHNGVQIGGLTRSNVMNGIQLGMLNEAIQGTGTQLGLYNYLEKGKGVQIEIFNKAKQFKGVQLGLWNVNQKRKTPLIGWNFKDNI